MLPLIRVVTHTLLGWVGWRPRVFDMNHDAHDVNHWSWTKPFSSFPSFLSSPRRCWWNWLLSLRLCCRLQSTLRGHLSQQPLRRGGNWSWWNAISPFRVSLSCLAWLAVRVGAGLFLHRPASSWPAPMLILARLGSNWDVGNLVGEEGNFDTIFTHWRWWRCVDALLTQAPSPSTPSWQGQAAVVLSTLERGSLHATQYLVGRPTRWSLLFTFGFLIWSSSW